MFVFIPLPIPWSLIVKEAKQMPGGAIHYTALSTATGTVRQLLPLSPFLRGAPSHRDGLQRLSPSRMLQHEQRRSQMRKTYSTLAGDTSADMETWFGLGSQPRGSPRAMWEAI